ncbi:hypothetical protein JCM10296v2_006413 [Rhodotorula toruloides]
MPSVDAKDWKSAADAKREAFKKQVDSYAYALPKVDSSTLDVSTVPLDSVMDSKHLQITNMEVGELVEKLQKGELKAVEVTKAFCHRAAIAHSLVNCLTEVYFDRAIKHAEELDAKFKQGGPRGPLHGLPISLKNQICVEGVESNMGYVGWIGRVPKKNSVLADCLVRSGAVLYCQTNIPQNLMSTECINAIYGRTVNGFNRNLSCGGSSGGEGALVGLRGSLLGFGSDIGGSIRVPSSFNGLYGLRGSYNRMPYGGADNSCQGLEAVSSVLGPLTTSVEGLQIVTKAVLAAEPWRKDPFVHYQPWRESVYQLEAHGGGKEKLCFAFAYSNGLVKPNPPYYRAMDMTRKALEAQGHKVIDWSFPEPEKCFDILSRVYGADSGEDIETECGRSGEPRMYGLCPPENPPRISVYQYWQLCYERRLFMATQIEAWEATESQTGTGRPVDAVIMPTSPYPSFRHDDQQDVSYTGVCNLNDWPTAVFPVTRVDPSVDKQQPAHTFHSNYPFDKINYERYDPEVFKNAPIGLQCIMRRGEDEAVIRVVEMVDAALKAQKKA